MSLNLDLVKLNFLRVSKLTYSSNINLETHSPFQVSFKFLLKYMVNWSENQEGFLPLVFNNVRL